MVQIQFFQQLHQQVVVGGRNQTAGSDWRFWRWWSGTQELPGGAGNTPPVSPPQGNNGGTGPVLNMLEVVEVEQLQELMVTPGVQVDMVVAGATTQLQVIQ